MPPPYSYRDDPLVPPFDDAALPALIPVSLLSPQGLRVMRDWQAASATPE